MNVKSHGAVLVILESHTAFQVNSTLKVIETEQAGSKAIFLNSLFP
jgi:hypothetical protein